MPRRSTIPRRRSSKVDSAHSVYELDLWLIESEPPIGRSVAVPADFTLARLHDVIQRVMPWEGDHMHEFRTRAGRRYSEPPMPDVPFAMETFDLDEEEATLRDVFEQLKDTMVYEYDFGDCWGHRIKLVRTHAENPFDRLPLCLAGENAGPPEDCGGVIGYAALQEALHNPQHPEHEKMLEWMGLESIDEVNSSDRCDPAAFDLETVNRGLAAAFSVQR